MSTQRKNKKKLKEVRREENPEVCIQKFYQFLELNLKHRVKAKMGSTLKVDHMTMRHITKSSQVVYGANRNVNQNMKELSTASTTVSESAAPPQRKDSRPPAGLLALPNQGASSSHPLHSHQPLARLSSSSSSRHGFVFASE